MINIDISRSDTGLSLTGGAPVKSSTAKLVLRLPDWKEEQGQALLYPEGTILNGHPVGGQPIKDFEGVEKKGRGVVFYNYADNSIQAAAGNGSELIIFNLANEAMEHNAQELMRWAAGKQYDINQLSYAGLSDIIKQADALGLTDRYDSNQEYVKAALRPVTSNFYARDDKQFCEAFYVPGQGRFSGTGAREQKFFQGAVIVKKPSGDIVLVQPDIAKRTYNGENGDPLNIAKLPLRFISDFSTPSDLLDALAPCSPAQRREILSHGNNRNLALNSGASVALIDQKGEGIENTSLFVIERKKDGQPDGIGAIGGLSQRIAMGMPSLENFIRHSPHPDLMTQTLLAFADDTKNRTLVDTINQMDFGNVAKALLASVSEDDLRIALVQTIGHAGFLQEQDQKAIENAVASLDIADLHKVIRKNASLEQTNTALRPVQDALLFIASRDDWPNHLKETIQSVSYDDLQSHLWGSAITARQVRDAFRNEAPEFPELAETVARIVSSGIYKPPYRMLSPAGKEIVTRGNDDVLCHDGKNYVITTDIGTIAKNTAWREAAEELAEVGVSIFPFRDKDLASVPMPGVKDDAYITNSTGKGWQGKDRNLRGIYAVDPVCYAYHLSPEEAEHLQNQQPHAENGREVFALKRIPLLEALEHYGRDDIKTDYKYPHEYMVNWVIASRMLGHDPQALENLAATTQGNIFRHGGSHTLDFRRIAENMHVAMSDLDAYAGLPQGSFERIQKRVESEAATRPELNRSSGSALRTPGQKQNIS